MIATQTPNLTGKMPIPQDINNNNLTGKMPVPQDINNSGTGRMPVTDNETVQNYLWSHTVICPNCQFVIPLSHNWWVYNRPEKINLHRWCAVKPIPNLLEKKVDFELIKGHKGKGTTIETESVNLDTNVYATVKRSVGKCCNCDHVIEQNYLMNAGVNNQLGYQLYAVAFISDSKNLVRRRN